MKILIFAPFFPPDPTGSSVFAAEQALELLSRGHELLIVTNAKASEESGFEETVPTNLRSMCKVIRLKSTRLSFGRASWNYRIPISFFGLLRSRVLRSLSDFQPNAVLIHSILFDLNVFALLWSRLWARKTVLIAHTPLWHQSFFIRKLLETYGIVVLRPLVRRSSIHTVAVDKRTLVNALRFYATETRTTVIPISVNPKNVVGGDSQVVKELIPNLTSPIVLSLGHVVPIRNRKNLVQALPLLLKRFPSLSVVVVGMVSDMSFLDLAESLGVRRHIFLTGAVDHGAIKHFLAAATVEAHDLDGLGMGITTIEAMAAGVPVVAWVPQDNYPGISLGSFSRLALIEDGKPETVAAMIEKCILDRDFVEDVCNSQFDVVKRVFSTEMIVQRYEMILRRP